jgi:hypothetical protein
VQFTDTLWQLTGRAANCDYTTVREHVSRYISNLGTPELDRGLLLLRGARSVHLVGGGYLNSIWPANLGIVAAAAHLARDFGVEAFATGLGLLPQPPASVDQLRVDFRSFTSVSTRDAGSSQLFDLPMVSDDVFLQPTFALSKGEPAPEDIVVLVQGDLNDAVDIARERRLIERFVAMCESNGSAGLLFLEGYPQHDSRDWWWLRERFPTATFMPFDHLWRHGFPVRAGQRWLTSRFHFHLLAAIGGAQGVAFVLDENYYEAKHGSLAAIGTGWAMVSASGVADDAATIDSTRNADFDSVVSALASQKMREAVSLYPSRRSRLIDPLASRVRSARRKLRSIVGSDSP